MYNDKHVGNTVDLIWVIHWELESGLLSEERFDSTLVREWQPPDLHQVCVLEERGDPRIKQISPPLFVLLFPGRLLLRMFPQNHNNLSSNFLGEDIFLLVRSRPHRNIVGVVLLWISGLSLSSVACSRLAGHFRCEWGTLIRCPMGKAFSDANMKGFFRLILSLLWLLLVAVGLIVVNGSYIYFPMPMGKASPGGEQVISFHIRRWAKALHRLRCGLEKSESLRVRSTGSAILSL